MHYYQFNIGDYAKSTRFLSNNEDLAYRRMIDRYYDKESPLTSDTKKLSRLIGLPEAAITSVLSDFFFLEGDTYHHKKIDADIVTFKAKGAAARVNGKLGGRPKKPKANPNVTQDKPKETQGVNLANPKKPKANPTVTQTNANETPLQPNQEPLTINQEPLTNNQLSVQSAKANEPYEIFTYWKNVMKKSNSAQFTAKRMKKVKDRLKDDYTVDEIKLAIYGCSITPHNNGTDPKGNGQRYDDLELICRTGENVERFISNAQPKQQQQFSAATQRTIDNLNNVELD